MSYRSLAQGAAAGFLATAPMTAFMVGTFQRLPRSENYPLPPREITDELLEKAGVEDVVPEPVKLPLALFNHFAFGTMSGLFLSRFFQKLDLPVPAKGVLLGSGLWAVNYLGWLPAARILKPATKHPARRNALMIGAHFVWGTSAAWLLRRWSKKDLHLQKNLEMA